MRILRLPSVASVLLVTLLIAGALSRPMVFAAEADATLSVLYFANTRQAVEFDWLKKGLADMLVSDLGSVGTYKIIEREDLQKIVKEQELALSGLLDETKAPEVGKILNANVLVYGSFIASGGDIRLDAKAVRVESGAVLCAVSSAGKADAVLALERDLAAKLAAGLDPNWKRSSSPADASAATDSLSAARAYYQGMESFDAGRYGEAAELFGLAVREDPSFLKPGKGLEDAYKFLKDFKKQRWRREMNTLAADIADLIRRIKAPVFYSFGDAVMNPAKYGWKSAEEVTTFYHARPNVLNGNTPTQAVWYLQNLLGELGRKAVEYFQDTALRERCGAEVLRWADYAEKGFPKDSFLPETIYQRLFVLREKSDWTGVKDVCERLMGDYPDYRMMWAVEDMYEDALEKLKGSSESIAPKTEKK
ncbi:MAG: CsgG/HfaB family protein [Treponemataceae bacterium]